MRINDPAVLAEVRSAFNAYEGALLANDLKGLDSFFWHSERVIRYGISDMEYGIESVRAFRIGNRFDFSGRTLGPTVITTFDDNFATANTEFRNEDREVLGRQSQTWAKLPEGWRIVSAHVSLVAADAERPGTPSSIVR